MKKSLLCLGAGAALMGFFGSLVGHHIGMEGWAMGKPSMFAFGIVLFGYAPVAALQSRVRRLEEHLKLPESNT